ncbi:hypothetical protein NQZ68_000600 [Dissostichus eleginoides]|nr:hypothetical protein NQZ68_000600 [Dissostichus eleginoides]
MRQTYDPQLRRRGECLNGTRMLLVAAIHQLHQPSCLSGIIIYLHHQSLESMRGFILMQTLLDYKSPRGV